MQALCIAENGQLKEDWWKIGPRHSVSNFQPWRDKEPLRANFIMRSYSTAWQKLKGGPTPLSDNCVLQRSPG